MVTQSVLRAGIAWSKEILLCHNHARALYFSLRRRICISQRECIVTLDIDESENCQIYRCNRVIENGDLILSRKFNSSVRIVLKLYHIIGDFTQVTTNESNDDRGRNFGPDAASLDNENSVTKAHTLRKLHWWLKLSVFEITILNKIWGTSS